MASYDFKLRHFQHKPITTEEPIHILLQFRQDISALEEIGFQLTSRAGNIAAGFIQPGDLQRLLEHPEVILAEASRPFKDELDLSTLAIHLIDPATHSRTIPSLGRGAIIGVIDSSFDLTHPCFCGAVNETRILAAWDQANLNEVEGTMPSPLGYGVIYTQKRINQALYLQETLVIKNDKSAASHGTSVTGIAAGNGIPDGVYTGIAPEAELILVTYRNAGPVGGSSYVLDAIKYILDQANKREKPVVINFSQGDNIGAHDGTSLLEKAIDILAEQEGLIMVNSAGNQRSQKHHVEGMVKLEKNCSLSFNLAHTKSVDGDYIDLWYDKDDRFAIALRTPGGWESDFVIPGTEAFITLPSGNQAYICSQIEYPTNGDNRISIILEKGEGWETGRWELILRGNEVTNGRFDAWTDRHRGTTLITFPQGSDNCTVTLPGTSRHIITVGGLVSRAADNIPEQNVVGDLEPMTSYGPTRDGRVKPNLTAPGFQIMAPGDHKVGGSNPYNYGLRAGTSMAAPHVSGLIALLLSLNPMLNAKQIKAILEQSAASDSFTDVTPNLKWGQGKLDAEAAYKALSTRTIDGGRNMKGKNRYDLELSIPNKDRSGTIPVRLQIEVEDGNILNITGTNGETRYEGTLFLKPVERAEGGDECIVCRPNIGCVEEDPCPYGSKAKDKEQDHK